MNIRKIYDNAFESIKIHEKMASAFEAMGFSIEDGNGIISQVVFEQMSRDIDTIIECLGLHEEVKKAKFEDCGLLEFDLSIYYEEDNNEVTSILSDDLFNVLIFAEDKGDVQDALWRIFVEHDLEAIEYVQTRYHGIHFGNITKEE